MLFIMKKPKDEKYIVIKAYKFTALEISLYHHILRVSAIPTYRAYWLDNINNSMYTHLLYM